MKKIFFFSLITLFAVALLISGCSDDASTSSNANNDSSAATSNVSDAGSPASSDTVESNDASDISSDASDDISENSSTDVSDDSSDISDPDESSTDVSTDDSDVPDNSDDPDVSGNPDTSDDPDTPDNPPSDDPSDDPVPDPDVDGEGTKDNPYLAIPDENMHAVTFKIPAESSVYYMIYRVGGMDMKIKDSNAYVIYDGTTYKAKSGTVSLHIEEAMASEAITLQIGNLSSEAKSFEIVFTNPEGTYMNPAEIKDISDEYTVSLEEEASTGYYFKYTAEENGTLVFALTATKDSMMAVTNNSNSAQRTTEADGTASDDGTKYVEIEVSKGDEIIINVGALPNKRGKYPAVDISWTAEYK